MASTSNALEVAIFTGYAKKGPAVTITASSQSSGTYKLVGSDVVVTAGAASPSFRYVVLYNDTGGSSSTRPVIGWWDYGSSIALANGETFTIDLDATNGILQNV